GGAADGRAVGAVRRRRGDVEDGVWRRGRDVLADGDARALARDDVAADADERARFLRRHVGLRRRRRHAPVVALDGAGGVPIIDAAGDVLLAEGDRLLRRGADGARRAAVDAADGPGDRRGAAR